MADLLFLVLVGGAGLAMDFLPVNLILTLLFGGIGIRKATMGKPGAWIWLVLAAVLLMLVRLSLPAFLNSPQTAMQGLGWILGWNRPA